MENQKFTLEGSQPETDLTPSAGQLAVLSTHENLILALSDVKFKLEELEEKKDLIESTLIDIFKTHKVTSIKTEYALVSLVEGSRKKYGESIALIEEELKSAKADAESKGEFELVKSKPFLRVTKK